MLPGGRPWLARPWLMADALQVAPWLVRSGSCVNCAPLVACPGLWLMRSRWSPGGYEIKFTTKKGRKCPDFCAFVLKLSPIFCKYLKIKYKNSLSKTFTRFCTKKGRNLCALSYLMFSPSVGAVVCSSLSYGGKSTYIKPLRFLYVIPQKLIGA